MGHFLFLGPLMSTVTEPKPETPAAAVATADKKKKRRRRKGGRTRYVINCRLPVEDGIMDPAAMERYLHEKIKVDGKRDNLGDKISIAREKTRIQVLVVPPFSKRYLKYLVKKFLKKQQLRDYLALLPLTRAPMNLNTSILPK